MTPTDMGQLVAVMRRRKRSNLLVAQWEPAWGCEGSPVARSSTCSQAEQHTHAHAAALLVARPPTSSPQERCLPCTGGLRPSILQTGPCYLTLHSACAQSAAGCTPPVPWEHPGVQCSDVSMLHPHTPPEFKGGKWEKERSSSRPPSVQEQSCNTVLSTDLLPQLFIGTMGRTCFNDICAGAQQCGSALSQKEYVRSFMDGESSMSITAAGSPRSCTVLPCPATPQPRDGLMGKPTDTRS